MLSCFAESADGALPVCVLSQGRYAEWLAKVPEAARAWLGVIGFAAKPGAVAMLPAADGTLDRALLVVGDKPEPWDAASLQAALPAGTWRLDDPEGLLPAGDAALGWGLASYSFGRYRKATSAARPRLVVRDGAEFARSAARRGGDLARPRHGQHAGQRHGPAAAPRPSRARRQRHGAEVTVIGRRRPARGQLSRRPRRRPRPSARAAPAGRAELGRADAPDGHAGRQGRVLRHRRPRHQAVERHAADEEGHGRRGARAGAGRDGHGAGLPVRLRAADPGGRERHLRRRLPAGRRAAPRARASRSRSATPTPRAG